VHNSTHVFLLLSVVVSDNTCRQPSVLLEVEEIEPLEAPGSGCFVVQVEWVFADEGTKAGGGIDISAFPFQYLVPKLGLCQCFL
jgi:hypothetical protein